jgi:hypothetical protein
MAGKNLGANKLWREKFLCLLIMAGKNLGVNKLWRATFL